VSGLAIGAFLALGLYGWTGLISERCRSGVWSLPWRAASYERGPGIDQASRRELEEELEKVDPYSTYLSPEAYESFSIDSRQEYQGIGVSLQSTVSGVLIRHVFADGPADRAGIMPGDILVGVEGADVRRWAFAAVVDALRGRAGTSLSLRVEREGNGVDFRVERSSIWVPSIQHLHLTEDRILYLRIDQFGERTAKEFDQALQLHLADGIKGLVVDLRENTGGVFRTSIELLDAFYPKGALMLKTRQTDEARSRNHLAKHAQMLVDIPTIILINRNTASASEVVAGSLQVTGKALVIGERSLGKGSIQTVYSLNRGDAYKKTTSYYYFPDDSSIHNSGVVPDIVVDLTPESYRDYRIARQQGLAAWQVPEDPVLQTALHYMREG
jgi:carboxyl-terminal processing protease